MLADEATDMAAKLGEVAQMTREMGELQSLAQRCHSQPRAALCDGDDERDGPPLGQGAQRTNEDASGGAGANGGATVRAPLQVTPATTKGRDAFNLEAALDGLDLDGLLQRLESEHGTSKTE